MVLDNFGFLIFIMRITLYFIFIFGIVLTGCNQVKSTTFSSDAKSLSVLFYNVENLFDTEDDPKTYDEEFTPNGKKSWTKERYNTKLLHLGKVVSSIDSNMPDLFGLCEIENLGVLEDLNASAYFKEVGYEILHQDSPDSRGIDVALFYNPEKIQLEIDGFITSKLPAGDRPNTRQILHAKGTLKGDAFHVFVNHWPSRSGGKKETEPNRLTVANNLSEYLMDIRRTDENAQILLMGDFNDYPNDKSIYEILRAGAIGKARYSNMMWDAHKSGKGSYNYRGDWGALDQFIVTPNLTNGEGVEADQSSVKFFQADWMMHENSYGNLVPSRTYGGPNYYGGYSDHLPIFMRFTW